MIFFQKIIFRGGAQTEGLTGKAGSNKLAGRITDLKLTFCCKEPLLKWKARYSWPPH
jgi:hypothetical protein